MFFLNQQIHRGCHIHCPPLSLHTPWKQEKATSQCRLPTWAEHSVRSHPWSCLVKLHTLSLSTTPCNWTGLPLKQTPNSSDCHTSSTLLLDTGAPQGCVLSPLLFTPNALPAIKRTLLLSMRMTPLSSAALQATLEPLLSCFSCRLCELKLSK